MVEFDPHLHGPHWLHHVRLIGEEEAGMIGIEDRFGDWIEHTVTQTTLNYADYPPHTGLRTVLAA